MTNLTPSSIHELAEQLAGPGRYKFDRLLKGLERERWRLGSRRYLTVLWKHEFDIDGLTDWIYLGKSFRSLDDAKRHAAQELAVLKDAHLSSAWGSWVVDPERESHFLPQAEALLSDADWRAIDRAFATAPDPFGPNATEKCYKRLREVLLSFEADQVAC